MIKKPRQKLKITKEQELKDQTAIWYKKLENSGFEDIEKDEYHLKQHSSKFNDSRPDVRYAWAFKQEYYSMAHQFLNNYKFASNLDKIIWEYHANGISLRNIAKILKKLRIKKIKPTRDKIHSIIKPLVIEMKRMYLPGFK